MAFCFRGCGCGRRLALLFGELRDPRVGGGEHRIGPAKQGAYRVRPVGHVALDGRLRCRCRGEVAFGSDLGEDGLIGGPTESPVAAHDGAYGLQPGVEVGEVLALQGRGIQRGETTGDVQRPDPPGAGLLRSAGLDHGPVEGGLGRQMPGDCGAEPVVGPVVDLDGAGGLAPEVVDLQP